jgi:hypothetical protein
MGTLCDLSGHFAGDTLFTSGAFIWFLFFQIKFKNNFGHRFSGPPMQIADCF